MSLVDAPRELHAIILSYLPTDDIYLSYQPVCKEWYNHAAETVTEFYSANFSTAATREAKTNLLSISSRFPNLKKIIWELSHEDTSHERKDGFLDMAELAKQMSCTHLELFMSQTNTKHNREWYIMFCNAQLNSTEWKDQILSKFPKYCAINATNISIQNTKEQILADLQGTRITHAVFTDYVKNEDNMTALLEFIFPTLTHIIVNMHTRERGEADKALWNFLLRMIEKYNKPLALTHLITRDRVFHHEKLLSYMPNLQVFGGCIGDELAKNLVKYCPNMTKVIPERLYASTANILSDLSKLKTFDVHSISMYSGDSDIPSIQTMEVLKVQSLDTSENYRYFGNLRTLMIGIDQSCIKRIITYGKNLEEISVDKKLVKLDAVWLVDELPKLRFIHGLKPNISAPRLRNGVVDAIRWREEITRGREEAENRPKKRARKQK